MDSFSVAEEIVNDLTAYYPVTLPFRDGIVDIIQNKLEIQDQPITPYEAGDSCMLSKKD